jgi:putative N6-adenine-specific DNA methylase
MRELFVTCSPGIEEILKEELLSFGYSPKHIVHGGISIETSDFSAIYALNFSLRTAGRVLLPLLSFPCSSREDLYDAAFSIDWKPYFDPKSTLAIDARAKDTEAFRNSLFAAQVTKDAICDRLKARAGFRPSIDLRNPTVQLNVSIEGKRATLSFDTSCRSLSHRGYRQEGVVAPLRETSAAAMVLLSKFSKDDILIDTCAGGGTILVEAAYLATNTPPQYKRQTFGFMRHPEFDPAKWQEVKASALEKRVPLERGRIIGIEKNPKAFRILQKTLDCVGFKDSIFTILSDFRAAKLPFIPNVLVTNPPYGIRLEEVSTLEPLYSALGDFMKQNLKKPGRGIILSGNPELTKHIGLRTRRRHPVLSGGLDCRILEYDLY